MQINLTVMQFIKRSKHRHKIGDILALRLAPDRHLFARIIKKNPASVGGLLYYVYQHESPTLEVDSADLTKDTLLIPPEFQDGYGFQTGRFVFLRNEPIEPHMVLDHHHFKSLARFDYVDEYRNEVTNPISVVPNGAIGMNGIGNYVMLDLPLIKALGLEPVEDVWFEEAEDGTVVPDPAPNPLKASNQTFTNDAASDWINELVEEGITAVATAFNTVLTGDDIEAPDAECAVAAAAIIARLRTGQLDGTLLPWLDTWLEENQSVSITELVPKALAVLDRVEGEDSELAELWADAGGDGLTNWTNSISQVRTTLRANE